ncbi:hypothetical protein [Nocardia sp. X0981]
MADPSQASAIRSLVDQLLAAGNPFDPATAAAVCAVELREVPCSNPYMREFAGRPSTGLFETLTLRIPRPGSPVSLHLVALTVRPEVVVPHGELREYFELPRQGMTLEPHVPPEGLMSFQEEIGDTTLFLDLTAQSGTLTSLALHRRVTPEPHPTA